MSLASINCSHCKKIFFRDIKHINENINLGHKSYCSPACFSAERNKQVQLVCENYSCQKKFLRVTSHISFRNFCSSKCAMHIIGPQNGLKNHVKIKYCNQCGKRIRSSKKYCSFQCSIIDRSLDRKKLIADLQALAKKLKRTPTRRECNNATTHIKYFGSWNNSLIASGLKPHRSLNQRMYTRRKCRAKDGHICSSISETIIDDWLYNHNIPHNKEASYPETMCVADWSVKNIFIEYFGLAKDSHRYDKNILKKKDVCKKYNIPLIEIYPQHLYPTSQLDSLLKGLIEKR